MTTAIFDVESTDQGRLTKFYHLSVSFHKGWKMMYFSLEDRCVPVPPLYTNCCQVIIYWEGGKFHQNNKFFNPTPQKHILEDKDR